jgi:hypothetical protein
MTTDLTIMSKAANALAKAHLTYDKSVADVRKRADAMDGLHFRNKKNKHIYRISSCSDLSHAIMAQCVDGGEGKSFHRWMANPDEFESTPVSWPNKK